MHLHFIRVVCTDGQNVRVTVREKLENVREGGRGGGGGGKT